MAVRSLQYNTVAIRDEYDDNDDGDNDDVDGDNNDGDDDVHYDDSCDNINYYDG